MAGIASEIEGGEDDGPARVDVGAVDREGVLMLCLRCESARTARFVVAKFFASESQNLHSSVYFTVVVN